MKVDLRYEKKLWSQGFVNIAGLDEAGRGPLAGPVVAAAVIVSRPGKSRGRGSTYSDNNVSESGRHKISSIEESLLQLGVNDSKKISSKHRELLYEKLVNHPGIIVGVGVVDESTIDQINILQATKLAMQKAVKDLPADILLLDGNFQINAQIPQHSIIKGDLQIFSIAAASIIAKVTRDRLMHKLHQQYPQYGFDKHKGYGTALHVKNLKEFGPCEIHRKTFYPVSNLI